MWSLVRVKNWVSETKSASAEETAWMWSLIRLKNWVSETKSASAEETGWLWSAKKKCGFNS